MKRILLTLAVIAVGYLSYGQTNTFPSSGNVGVGTTSPQAPLHIRQVNADANGLIVQGNTINVDGAQHYVGLTLDGDYGNSTGNYSQIRSYSNLYVQWGTKLTFSTTQAGVANTLLERMGIDGYGRVGIGITTPSARLDVQNILTGPHTSDQQLFRLTDGYNNGANGQYFQILGAGNGTDYTNINLIANYGFLSLGAKSDGNAVSANMLNIFSNGYVGIGTTTPDASLTVNGTIHSKEVKVDMNILPDYVFKQTYNLATLKEIKTYIDQNHHLPEVPSAQQVAKEGLNLGAMNAILLKKVEELTLYLIEKEQQIKEIKEAQQSQVEKDQQDRKGMQDQLKAMQEQLNKLVSQKGKS